MSSRTQCANIKVSQAEPKADRLPQFTQAYGQYIPSVRRSTVKRTRPRLVVAAHGKTDKPLRPTVSRSSSPAHTRDLHFLALACGRRKKTTNILHDLPQLSLSSST